MILHILVSHSQVELIWRKSHQNGLFRLKNCFWYAFAISCKTYIGWLFTISLNHKVAIWWGFFRLTAPAAMPVHVGKTHHIASTLWFSEVVSDHQVSTILQMRPKLQKSYIVTCWVATVHTLYFEGHWRQTFLTSKHQSSRIFSRKKTFENNNRCYKKKLLGCKQNSDKFFFDVIFF